MRARVGRSVLAVGVAWAMALGACSDDEGSLRVDLDPDPTTSTVAPEAEGLPEGVHFGYLHELVAEHEEIVGTFDPAELLTGAEATNAAIDAGEEPLDFFIRNTDDAERLGIQIDPEAEVLDVRYGDELCCEPQATTPAQFTADRDAAGETENAVELTVADGVVTRLVEVYFP